MSEDGSLVEEKKHDTEDEYRIVSSLEMMAELEKEPECEYKV